MCPKWKTNSPDTRNTLSLQDCTGWRQFLPAAEGKTPALQQPRCRNKWRSYRRQREHSKTSLSTWNEWNSFPPWQEHSAWLPSLASRRELSSTMGGKTRMVASGPHFQALCAKCQSQEGLRKTCRIGNTLRSFLSQTRKNYILLIYPWVTSSAIYLHLRI